MGCIMKNLFRTLVSESWDPGKPTVSTKWHLFSTAIVRTFNCTDYTSSLKLTPTGDPLFSWVPAFAGMTEGGVYPPLFFIPDTSGRRPGPSPTKAPPKGWYLFSLLIKKEDPFGESLIGLGPGLRRDDGCGDEHS